jgi:hypothetical protein
MKGRNRTALAPARLEQEVGSELHKGMCVDLCTITGSHPVAPCDPIGHL